MEPAVRSTEAPTLLPGAWLQGDVLAEYLRFLELDEDAAPAPATRVPPVAWLQGEVRDEFLRFLEESDASAAAAVARPELQQEVGKEHESVPHGSDDDVGFDGHGYGVVVDVDDDYDYESFADDEEEEGGFMDDDRDMEEDDDPVLELLRPHILALPAFRSRAAAAVAGAVPQQQPPLAAFPRQAGGGWIDGDEVTDGFRCQDGRMRSELLRRRIMELRARYRACAAEAEVVRQQLLLRFPRHKDGWMGSDDDGEMADELPCQDDGWMGSDDDSEMADELPCQDDGWMGSGDDGDMTDDFTGNRNRLQLRQTY